MALSMNLNNPSHTQQAQQPVASPLSSQKKTKGGLFSKVNKLSAFLAIIALASIAGVGFLYTQLQETQEQLDYVTTAEGRNELAAQEVELLVQEVGKLIELPQDETPVIATIQDIESLVTEFPFYEGAQNGDKILVYEQAQQAYLYSVSMDKLINVGPIITENDIQEDNSNVEFGEGDVAGESVEPTEE